MEIIYILFLRCFINFKMSDVMNLFLNEKIKPFLESLIQNMNTLSEQDKILLFNFYVTYQLKNINETEKEFMEKYTLGWYVNKSIQ